MKRCTILIIIGGGGLVAKLSPILCDPMDYIAHQAPLSMGFPRKEHWSGLSFPSPGDLPNPEMEPGSPTLQANSLSSEPPGKPVGDIPIQKDSVGHHLDLREDHKSACSSSVRKE